MSNLDRSANTNAQVYSFIPTDQSPRDCPHKLDGFLQPLITEIEDLYLYGVEVYFKSAVPGFSPADDLAILRAVPLLVTADLRAHSEMGLTSAGGRMGCRRCEVVGEYVPSSNHYYYGNFLQRYYNRTEQRTVECNVRYGHQADSASSVAERKAKAQETGVTGVSILYRLYNLCGFSPIKDLVIDAMHALMLNLVRSELEKHMLADLGANCTCAVQQRTTARCVRPKGLSQGFM